MAVCRDPLVTQLNALGFNALRVPRTDFAPSSLLVRQRGTTPSLFGSLSDGFVGLRPPTVRVAAAGQFSAATTARYRKGLGLKLACDWLRSSPAGLDAALGGARRLSFRFKDVRLLSVPPAELSGAIAGAEPTVTLAALADVRLYAISEVLQAREFLMIAEGDGAQQADLFAPALASVGANAEVSIDASRAHAGIVAFMGRTHHTIGFKAHEIEVSGGDFRLAPGVTATALSHLTVGEPSFDPVLFDVEQLI